MHLPCKNTFNVNYINQNDLRLQIIKGNNWHLLDFFFHAALQQRKNTNISTFNLLGLKAVAGN